MRIKLLSLVALLALGMFSQPAFSATVEKTKNDRVVKDGLMVSLEYTLKSPEGKVLETSKGREPLKYIHGEKMMIPGLEKELTGMKIGGKKHVTVKPEEGYGKVDPNAVQEVPKDKIPPNALKVGAVLAARSPEGAVMPMTVREIKEKTVVMDMNHPMAGKTLFFDVKVVDIQPAPPPPATPAKPATPGKSGAAAQPAKPAEPAKK
ncbi:MAG: FKBP-type peptidyl-prolyl cis-trans isomerase [Candidatus Binatia bacterium]